MLPFIYVFVVLCGSMFFFPIFFNSMNLVVGGGNSDPKMCILMLSTALV